MRADDGGARPWALKLGLLALLLGLTAPFTGALAPFMLWAAASTGLVAWAYLTRRPTLFGKTPDGRLRWNAVPLLPFLALTRLGWWIAVRFSREPAWVQVTPDLYLGRWPRRGELPPQITRIVDLTAELPGPTERTGRTYHLLATLDGTGPDLPATARLLDELLTRDAPTYVHCAMGHGRSATLVCALLLHRKQAASVEEAEAMLRGLRPGVHLNPGQRQTVRRLCP